MTETPNVNIADPKANMYGCYPCPTCGSESRFTAKGRYDKKLVGTPVVVCDECCREEPLVEANS